MKDKPNSTRVYDAEGFRKRAACICLRGESPQEVLLVTSSRRPDTWIIPGGGAEPDEELAVTAVREVLEEAGVTGVLERSLGIFENVERNHRTELFILNVNEELPEWEDGLNRRRRWFSIEEALKQLAQSKPGQLQQLQMMLSFRDGPAT